MTLEYFKTMAQWNAVCNIKNMYKSNRIINTELPHDITQVIFEVQAFCEFSHAPNSQPRATPEVRGKCIALLYWPWLLISTGVCSDVCYLNPAKDKKTVLNKRNDSKIHRGLEKKNPRSQEKS